MTNQDVQIGTVLWYRPTSAQGVVKADSGRQFFFNGAEELGATTGLRVSFRVVTPDGGGPPELRDLALLGGSREIVDSAAAPPLAPAKKKSSASPRKPKAAAQEAIPAPPRSRPKGVLKEGTPVNHATWGSGHVVGSTSHFVSVEFLQGGRRNVSADELQDVGGHRGKPAPAPHKRRGGFNERVQRPTGRSHIRRERSGDENERAAGASQPWGDWDSVDE
jgi:hypothetical protein